MAKRKDDVVNEKNSSKDNDLDDLASSLIRDINKQYGERVAYNLATDEAPTIVKRWIDTGSIQLNYLIKNSMGGGYPEGRIIEISGLPSTGKSHLSYMCAANVQKMGGLVIYIDTENATPVEKLGEMGIDVRKRFVYCDMHCTEDVFDLIEKTIIKAQSLISKDVPVLVIWDSVGATSPKAELEGTYDQNTVGLQARVLAKGFRKITGLIGKNNVTLLCLNQLTTNIGTMHGDPYETKGGNGLRFHSSVRIRLGSGSPIKDKNGLVIGTHVTLSTKKNKLAPAYRKMEFDIIFGKGITENDPLFDEVRQWCDQSGGLVKDGKKMSISGSGAWKELLVVDEKTGDVLVNKKFYKSEFMDLMKDPQYTTYIVDLIDSALCIHNSDAVVQGDSDEEEDV